MRQLLLLRHAKSSWDDGKLADRDRPLNQRGQQAATTMRRAMRELGLFPDLVLVSSAKRTLETLEALEPWDDTPLIEPMDALYLASLQQLFTILHGVAETVRSVLLIGHNPGMHELAITLAGPAGLAASDAGKRLAAGFPTGALADFAIAGPWWQLEAGGARLQHFVTPRSLEPAD
jgi:phosphohistidine phosphatase